MGSHLVYPFGQFFLMDLYLPFQKASPSKKTERIALPYRFPSEAAWFSGFSVWLSGREQDL